MKLAIAFIIFVAALCLGIVIISKVPGGKRSNKAKSQEAEEKLAAQSLVDIADVLGWTTVTTSGDTVVMIRVTGTNYSLKTGEEKDVDVERLALALAAERHPFKIHIQNRPIDATMELSRLNATVDELDRQILAEAKVSGGNFAAEKHIKALKARSALLTEIYIPQSGAESTAEGTKYTTRTYVSMVFPKGPRSQELAIKTADAFIVRIVGAGYSAKKMDPDEVSEFLINYYGRYPVSTENYLPK